MICMSICCHSYDCYEAFYNLSFVILVMSTGVIEDLIFCGVLKLVTTLAMYWYYEVMFYVQMQVSHSFNSC